MKDACFAFGKFDRWKLRGAVIQPYLFGFWLGHLILSDGTCFLERWGERCWTGFRFILKGTNSGAIYYAFMRSDANLAHLCGLM